MAHIILKVLEAQKESFLRCELPAAKVPMLRESRRVSQTFYIYMPEMS